MHWKSLSSWPPALVLGVLAIGASLASGDEKPASPFKLTAHTDHADAFYKKGETVTFLFELTDHDTPVSDQELKWTQSKDGVAPITNGSVKLSNGKASITGKLDEPGVLQCKVTYTPKGAAPIQALAGAAVDPLELKPSLPVPDDFDAFWAEQKKKLASVPINPRLTRVQEGKTGTVELYDVQLDAIGPAPVSGYFAKPAGAKPKSLPILLSVQGAGVRSSSQPINWAAKGMLAMDINAHGIPNGKPESFYKELADGALKDYRTRGHESRDQVYFLNMFLRELRALEFLRSQPEWDGKHVIVFGSSQGGFQAFAATGLDPTVTFFAAGVPAGCDHTGVVVGRINGWPKLVPNGPDGKPDPAALQAARYFDNVNFATRTKAKGCIVTTGFIDTTCPPSSVYTAYNNLNIPKSIHTDPLAGHMSTPAANAAMQKAVADYLKSDP